MNRNHPVISLRQLFAVLFLILFPLGTQRLFSRLTDAGSAAWLCPLLAGGVVLAAAILIGRKKLGDPLAFPKTTPRRFWSGACFLWGILFTAAQGVRVSGRLADSLGAAPVLLTAATLLQAGWMAAGGLPAFARASEIFILIIMGSFGLIFLGGIFRIQWDYLILWESAEITQVPGGVFAVLGTLAMGCWVLLFAEEIGSEDKCRPRVLRRLALLFLLLTAAMILVLGRFGPALTAQVDRPFFQMVSGLGFEGGFQRLEELVSALWFLGDAALLSFLLLALRRLLGKMTERKESRRQIWGVAAAAFLLSLPVELWHEVLAGEILLAGNLVAGGLLLLFSVRFGRAGKSRKKFEKGG